MTTQVARTTVNITVTRNEYSPKFSQGEYRKERVSEKTSVGTGILTVQATDRDGVGIARVVFVCAK